MKMDCNNCGGSGGGPDPETECRPCRGSGGINDDRYEPCLMCSEPTETPGYGLSAICENCLCEECGEEVTEGNTLCDVCIEESGCGDD